MDPKELFLSTVRMEQTEKVPFFPRDLTLGMDTTKIATDEVFTVPFNAEASAKSVISLQRMLRSDATIGTIFSYGLECFGGVTKYPSDGIPYVSGYAFADPENMERHDPSEIVCDLIKGFRRSSEIVKEKIPDVALITNVPGPMTMAGFARGVETLMMDLALNKEFVDKLMRFSTDAICHEMRYVSKDLADGIFFASATDNPDMIGLEAFMEYSIPAVKELTSRVHEDGLLSIFHPHGVFSTEDREDILRASVGAGIDGFQFSEGNEPEGILAVTKGKCSIMGGVNAYSTLLLGPDERIVRDTRGFMNDLKDEPYVMMCSCSVHRGLPLHNIQVMADTIHQYNEGIR